MFTDLYHRIIAFFTYLKTVIVSWFEKQHDIVTPATSIVDNNKVFVEKHTATFMKYLNNDTMDILNICPNKCDGCQAPCIGVKNSNIDNVFYSKRLYQEMLVDPKNVLEKKWKTNILYVNTPRGNIVMYYDVYKLGFTYYCDSSLPYNILNSVAMKYVMYFRCLDFFIDEEIRPTDKPSPLLKLLEEDKKGSNDENKPDSETNAETKDNTDSKNNEKKQKIDMKTAPFAKFKQYNKASTKASTKVTENAQKSEKTTTYNDKSTEKQKEYNRFIYLGKIVNYDFLQKIPKKRPFVKMSHFFSDVFTSNTLAQNEVFNYRNFKNLKNALVLETD